MKKETVIVVWYMVNGNHYYRRFTSQTAADSFVQFLEKMGVRVD